MDQMMTADHAGAEPGSLEHIHRIDRQATLERLIAYLAHHLGTPLNVIEGRATMIATGQVASGEFERNARIIMEQSSRMVRFLRDIVSSARRETGSRKAVEAAEEATAELGAVAREAVAMFRPIADAHGASICFENQSGPANVRGSAESLLVALSHLVENGVRATPKGATLVVRLRQESSPEDDRDPGGTLVPFFCIDVDDEGSGIGRDVLPRLFKPFTTTREDRQAIGLGLFIAQSIAKEHGGWLEGANKSKRGALFTLHLPQGQAHA
jgi:two-component system NtrC family sensor kinase